MHNSSGLINKFIQVENHIRFIVLEREIKRKVQLLGLPRVNATRLVGAYGKTLGYEFKVPPMAVITPTFLFVGRSYNGKWTTHLPLANIQTLISSEGDLLLISTAPLLNFEKALL